MSDEEKAFQEGVEWAAEHFATLLPGNDKNFDSFFQLTAESYIKFDSATLENHTLRNDWWRGAMSVAKLVGD